MSREESRFLSERRANSGRTQGGFARSQSTAVQYTLGPAVAAARVLTRL